MDMTQNEALHVKYREKAVELVSKMTLEEKMSQTLSWAPAVDRLGIKAYNWWNEALHGVARAGVATVFPQAITLAGSFDEDLLEEVADVISTEGRAKYNEQQKQADTDIYKGLTFWSPNINIFRDPRWGRGHETYGEDPYLTSRLGLRFVKGLQGHDEKYMKLAACAKHFAVHSGPEDIRHSFDAVVSEEDLYETYLPAFKTLIKEARVEAVMGAYNRVNGEPCCGSKFLLKDLLRDTWGFRGHVTSDCWAIKDLNEGHGVTSNILESVAMAINNGCNLNCGNCYEHLPECVEQGLVDEKQIDEMVTELFTTRFKLGEMEKNCDNPYDKLSLLDTDTDENKAINLKAARKSIVMLKNADNILPLDLTKIKTIGVIGPNANSRKALVGNYEGTSSEYITVLEGIKGYIRRYSHINKLEPARVLYSEGCHLFKDRVEGLAAANDRMSEVKSICQYSDVVVCVMGLDASLEGEEGDAGNEYGSGDKKDLKLPGLQQEIIDTALASGKPVVVVLMAGSAIELQGAEEKIAGYIYAGYPGAQGGKAVADILFGACSPEGKLPITFYKSTEELPDFTDYAMKGRTYRYMEQKALYPFGYGLSYAPVELANAKLESFVSNIDDEVDKGNCQVESNDDSKNDSKTDSNTDRAKLNLPVAHISADMTNLGAYETSETMQVYVSVHKEGAPKYQLKGLKKVTLLPGEMQHVEMDLPFESFGLHLGNEEVTVDGDVTVYVGTHQPDDRSFELTGSKPEVIEISCNRNKIRVKKGSLLDEIKGIS